MSGLEYLYTPVDEFKAAGAEGEISGYGAVYRREDLGGDKIAVGALADGLKTHTPVMLFNHDPGQILGVWDSVEDNSRGLKIKGRINMDTQLGRDVHSNMKMGALKGFSIGYQTHDAEFDSKGVRTILRATVFEVSAVAIPMQPAATIDAVKAFQFTDREFETRLMQDAGLSRSVARALMRDGLKGVRAMQDAGAELDELVAAVRNRIAIKTGG